MPKSKISQFPRVGWQGKPVLRLGIRDVSHEKRDPPTERIETAHLRQPPDFIIIGTQRGGTTSLFRYLAAHPEIGQASRKEVHYFDRYYENGMDWYLAHFPERGQYRLVGEATPILCISPQRAGTNIGDGAASQVHPPPAQSRSIEPTPSTR